MDYMEFIKSIKKYFSKLLEDQTVTSEDEEKIKNLLSKPFNPYIRRHSALTEKSMKLTSSMPNMHAGGLPGLKCI
jgi:uncharacterized HAD superfamily protein